MLLIGLTSLLIAVALASKSVAPQIDDRFESQRDLAPSRTLYWSSFTPILLTRITSLVLIFSAALAYNCLYTQAIGGGLGLYNGLFHVTNVTQGIEFFMYLIGALILMPWIATGRQASSSGDVRSSEGASQRVAYASMEDSSRLASEHGAPAPMGGSSRLGSEHVAHPTAFSESELDSEPAVINEYGLVILFSVMGATFFMSSADLVSMYLSIELQSFGVYILAALARDSEAATSAGLKYFLLGALSSALILLGSSIVYAYTGLTQFEAISSLLNDSKGIVAATGSEASTTIIADSVHQGAILGVLIIGVGFLFKVAAAPLHNWAPDVYDGAPTIVSTWLTVMPKISIFVFLLSQADLAAAAAMVQDSAVQAGNPVAMLGSMNLWQNLMLTSAVLSLVIGTVVGLAQYRLKRLLAYSTISHVGFMLLALSVNTEQAVASLLFYLIQYSITNLDTFLIALATGYVILANPIGAQNNRNGKQGAIGKWDIQFINQFRGQFEANPILGLSFGICLFSMAGIPPLIGFFGKYAVLYGAIQNGYYFLALIGIIASVISAAYYLRIVKVIHFDPLASEHGVSEAGLNTGTPAGTGYSGLDSNSETNNLAPAGTGYSAYPAADSGRAGTGYSEYGSDYVGSNSGPAGTGYNGDPEYNSGYTTGFASPAGPNSGPAGTAYNGNSEYATAFASTGLAPAGSGYSDPMVANSSRAGTACRLTSTHSYVIAVLTLWVACFLLAPSLLINSSQLLALTVFPA